jgi:thiol-disulfide isomerase/thioredoxin
MKLLPLAFLLALMAGSLAVAAHAAESVPLPIERQVAAAIKSSRVTVVHFWAPWCPNCKAELAAGGWSGFITGHPDVDFIFVTAWNPTDGRELLAANGVGTQKNFTLLLHPNGSRKRADKMTAFLDLPVSWIPTTWIFKDGRLRYALNYGELHFPMLGQLIADASDAWKH